jgi:hypothetical protein
MSKRNDILNWLSSEGDYSAGLSLFAECSKNKSLFRFLSAGTPTGVKKQKLRYELEKLLPSLPEEVDVEHEPQEHAPELVIEVNSPEGEVVASVEEKPKINILRKIFNYMTWTR